MDSKENPYETITPTVVSQQIADLREEDMPLRTRVQSTLYKALFCDISRHFPNFALEDFLYLQSRLEVEGMTFCLHNLPLLGRAMEVSLISMEPLKVPNGWKLQSKTRLPKFLNELFSQLFDEFGMPLYEISRKEKYNDQAVWACRYIRQVCMMWSKVIPTRLEEDVKNEELVVRNKHIESIVQEFVQRVSKDKTINFSLVDKDIMREARRLLRCVLEGSCSPYQENLKDFISDPWGRHGPGAVAGGERGCEKWDFHIWPGLPRELFAWNRKYMVEGLKSVKTQPDAKLLAVPKDFRGPRIICIEPKENQFAQQGIMDLLYQLITHNPLSRRSINFFETEESRALCYNDAYATIDLKDASDNLSLALCRLLLPRWFFVLVTRYRSRHVIVRGISDDTVRVKTTCITTMGNATCFPLQTLVFWALALGTMIVLRDSFPKGMRKALTPFSLRVFGDDIIVPRWSCSAVCDVLETAGLLVNTSKTCNETPVRESCGEWVFMDQPVRIARFKTASVADHSAWLHWRDLIKDLGLDDYPAFKSRALEYVDDYFKPTKYRFNKNLQRMEALVPRFIQPKGRTELLNYAGLYAWYVSRNRIPFLRGTRKWVKMRWQDVAAL